jgi:hypothetical protein
MMGTYAPICINEEIELAAKESRELAAKNIGRIGRIMEWLYQHYPLGPLINPEVPHGRASVEAQLRDRLRFPSTDWSELGYTEADILSVLGVIKKEMNHPNHHYIPDDPMSLLVIEDCDLALNSVHQGIRENFGVEFKFIELAEMCFDRKWTIGDLVKFVLDAKDGK